VFSGIVTAQGRVEAPSSEAQGGLRLVHPAGWGQLAIGDSVAVNGCCVTVVHRDANRFTVEVMPETLRRTNLGRLQTGGVVNLEAALALGAPVGGHLVSGHVDATGEVTAVASEQNARWLTVRVPEEVGRYCVPQGSIAIDGCALTLVSIDDGQGAGTEVRVSLIPHTVKTTLAANYLPGSVVNLEADSVAKLVERLLAPHLVSPGGGRVRPAPSRREGG